MDYLENFIIDEDELNDDDEDKIKLLREYSIKLAEYVEDNL
jgi:hypothetical protein